MKSVKSAKGDAEEKQGAELVLASMMLLQRVGADDATSTLEVHLFPPLLCTILTIPQACVDGVSKLLAPPAKSPKKKSKKAPSADAEEDSEPEPIDVLVDIIIGFLEKSTAFTRAVGNQSFALLSGVVKGSTMDLILAVRAFSFVNSESKRADVGLIEAT